MDSTHRVEEPVSKRTRKFWGGVPMLISPKQKTLLEEDIVFQDQVLAGQRFAIRDKKVEY